MSNKYFHSFVTLVALAAILVACGPQEEPEPPTPQIVAVTGVTLSQSTLALETGATGNLTATVNPANATNKTVTWSSSNSSVATVFNGTVTAVAAGTATVTATADGKSATCQVTVSKKVVPVTAIEFIETDHSVYIGKSIQLSVKLTPSNATE
ncbi:MAG: Ig-like domain-containing protein, partial [Bacteroidales bacterium]|nr:Ig-like domain-containing protein [Bacteroidales bacterium]